MYYGGNRRIGETGLKVVSRGARSTTESKIQHWKRTITASPLKFRLRDRLSLFLRRTLVSWKLNLLAFFEEGTRMDGCSVGNGTEFYCPAVEYRGYREKLYRRSVRVEFKEAQSTEQWSTKFQLRDAVKFGWEIEFFSFGIFLFDKTFATSRVCTRHFPRSCPREKCVVITRSV